MTKVSFTLNTQLSSEQKVALQVVLDLIAQDDFKEARFQFLGAVEGFHAATYTDPRGYKTVGYGFNLDDSGARAEFNAAFANEEDFLSGAMTFERVYSQQYQLSTAQGRTLFEYGADVRALDVDNLAGYSDITLTGYQRLTIESLYYNSGDLDLISQTLKGDLADSPPDLIDALKQIVELSNPTMNKDGTVKSAVHGIQNRRLLEGALFSNDANIILPESQFWKIVGWGRKSIAVGKNPNNGNPVESGTTLTVSVYGPYPSMAKPLKPTANLGAPVGRKWTIWDAQATGDVVTTLKNADTSLPRYTIGDSKGAVLTIDTENKKRADIDDLAETSNMILAGDGNDTLIGHPTQTTLLYAEAGNDTTQGGTGDDHHIGGKGNDLLSDQGGNDSYYFTFDEGHDVIEDADSIGKFFFNGVQINGLLIPQRADDETIIPGKWFYDLDGTLLLFTRVDNAQNPMPINTL